MSRHVSVVSGSRADFGPLRPLLAAIAEDSRLRLTTLVCAVGGPEESGRQVAAFADAGLEVDAVVEASDGASMGVRSARALAGVSEALERLAPDIVVVLGDRYEILAAAFAAHLLRIPIVHLSGGDETLGSLDDAMRHAISRLANLHLPTNGEAAGRLRALGIAESRIRMVGSTALDALVAFEPLSREQLAATLDVELADRVIAVSYHAATQADEPAEATMRLLLDAVRSAAPVGTVVITGSNSDEGGAAIDAVAAAAATTDGRMVHVASLGTNRYWSLLHHADVLVGNSSSALIEAPVIGIPVIDVGERQHSRIRAESCIHTPAERDAIAAAITRALTRPRTPEPSPYGDGRSVPRVIELLVGLDPEALLAPSPLPPLQTMPA
jgi:UDP-hydrolysing UDP-N-acetyl-D-glucosamine 2-epimerase